MRRCTPLCMVLTLFQAFHLPHVKSMPHLLWSFKKISQTAACTIVVWRSVEVWKCDTDSDQDVSAVK